MNLQILIWQDELTHSKEERRKRNMNKFKDKLTEEDIFVESESSNTSIISVEDIVKSNNKNDFNNIKESIDIEREKFGQNSK